MLKESVSNLQYLLRLGLSVVTELWHYFTKDWVTSVYAADIDSDGDVEILTSSRDGRLHVLTKKGDLRWERIIGTKAWVGTISCLLSIEEKNTPARIFVGTRDGKVYALDKDGQIVAKDGKVYPLDNNKRGLDEEKAAFWLDTGHVIRQVHVNVEQPGEIVIGSEDNCAYALDSTTGVLHWKFATHGWVRSVFSCDIDGDGNVETLVGSLDKHVYVLGANGQCLHQQHMDYPVHTLFAADIDQDGKVEILVGTDGKDLTVFTASWEEKWHHAFENRLLSLYVADVDGDKRYEIIAGGEDKHIYIFDAQGAILWKHNLGYRVFSVYARDVNKDGVAEILVGSESMRLHVFHFDLLRSRDLDKEIQQCYRSLEEPAVSLAALSVQERNLLADILNEDVKHKHITLHHAEQLLAKKEYLQALAELLRLEQQKVQLLWRKEKPEHIRTLCLGDVTGDRKQEIVLGTSDGNIQVFKANGRLLWSVQPTDQIVTVQTGYMDRGKGEDIIVCSSPHDIYIISSAKKQVKRQLSIDETITCMHVSAMSKRGPGEIIVGSGDKKLYIYGNDLQRPMNIIRLPLGVKVLDAYAPQEGEVPEIIAGSINHYLYAYRRDGTLLWDYETHDHIRAVSIKDIDDDGQIEVVVGSEDRNVHVLSVDGHLKWRYYLPHSVLSIDTCDVDGDGRIEILAGCADGYLYVLSRKGEMLGKHQVNDRIRVVRAADIDKDGNIEIALGTDDQLELLRVLNQDDIRLHIQDCWSAMQQEKPELAIIDELLIHPDPLVRAFALRCFAERLLFSEKDFEVLEARIDDTFAEVRKELIRAVVKRYSLHPQRAHSLLNKLLEVDDQEVRLFFVEQLPLLIKVDDQVGFSYLSRCFGNTDRFVRRAVIRKLHVLIKSSHEKHKDEIFHLLLVAAQDKESIWVQQEAGRTLARFLDEHQADLLESVYKIITRGIHNDIMSHIAHSAKTSIVQQMFRVVVLLLSDLNETNVLERVEQAVTMLAGTKGLWRGIDTWMIYSELHLLLSMRTLDDIAYYQCSLDAAHAQDNLHYQTVYRICVRLNAIVRLLRIFLRRSNLDDRLTSLLEAVHTIDMMSRAIEREYTALQKREAALNLPDHHIFELLLKRWRTIVQAQLSDLRGKADLKVELKTKQTRFEKQVAIWLSLENAGRGAANTVKVMLSHNDNFTFVTRDSFETEAILPGESTLAEFIIRPSASLLDLHFEIFYDDAEDILKMLSFSDTVELQAAQRPFRSIPNPYSTGTPTYDSNMFYGREKEVAFLQNNLVRTSAKTVIVLYGQRRSGKTSLLVQFANTHFAHAVAVLVDMQREAYDISINNFLYHLAFYIFQALKKRNIPVPQPLQEDFAHNPTFAFTMFLEDMEEFLADVKLILLLDEFEELEAQVKKGKLEPEIFAYLRSLMQHRQNINFLLSGTHKIEQLTRDYWSVFFNIARHYQISHLSSQGAQNLITKPVAEFLDYEPHAVTKIRQLTADQPYLIHLICRSLIEHCNEQEKASITINDVNTVMEEVIQSGQVHFDWLWKQLSPEEWRVLAAIAQGSKDEGRFLSLGEIEELYRYNHLPYKREYLLASLKTLLDTQVIEDISEDGLDRPLDMRRFRISVGLIRRWLRKEKSLEWMR